MAITQLSKSEVQTLLFDKLSLIHSEAEEAQGETEGPLKNAHMLKPRLKRIAVEAKRALSLLETYERVAKAGHCLHCGKSYAEHQEALIRMDDAIRVRAKTEPGGPICYALKRLFESVEIETYQSVLLDPVEI